MQQAKLNSVLGFVLAAVLLGTAVDATLNLGDTFKGTIDIADEDIVRFAGVAGEKIKVSVKATKSDLVPQIQVVDLTTMMDVVPVTNNSPKKKVSVKQIVLPTTGEYEIRVTGAAEGPIGAYTLKTGSKVGKDVTKPSSSDTVGAGETQETTFGGKAMWTLSGKITSSKKSTAVPGVPTIEMLSGITEGDPMDLTGFFDKKGNFVIEDLVLPELGTYVVAVENEGMTDILETKLKLKKNKVKKKTVTEGEG